MTPADKTDKLVPRDVPAWIRDAVKHAGDFLARKWLEDPDNDGSYRLNLCAERTEEFFRDFRAELTLQIQEHAPKDSWQPISTAVDDLNRRNQLKADLFDYLVWLQDRCPFRDAALEGKLGDYLVCASDGTTCWGKTYQEAVMVARKHDMGLQDSAPNAQKGAK